MTTLRNWVPALILTVGAVFTVGIDIQRSMSLEAPLDAAIPELVGRWVGQNVVVSEQELEAAGVTDHLLRTYAADSAVPAWSLYIGYYDRQLQGKSIHSPKNCLPGAGWEALASSEINISTATGIIPVNRYLLQKDDHQALVLYWYQGRGRVVANEYFVKANLLRDAALRQRSEEALVRIVVPIEQSEEDALAIAEEAARAIAPSLARVLPG